jgi:hypothetical protein
MDARSQSSESYWITQGIKFGALPQAPQVGSPEILNTAYREALKAGDAREGSAGTTLVRWLWPELIPQFELSVQIDAGLRPALFRGAARGPHGRATGLPDAQKTGRWDTLGNICLDGS